MDSRYRENKMGYFKRSEIDISSVLEPIDIKVLFIQSFLLYTTMSLMIFVVILLSNNMSFIKNLLYFFLFYILLIIPVCPLVMLSIYVHYNIIYRKDYVLINGIIDINYSPNSKFRRAIYVDDIINVIYMEGIPPFIFLKRRYWKYYKVFYFPSLTDEFYLIELVDNHKIIYDNKIYRLNQFKGNLKLVSNKYLAIPKNVLDEYKNRGYKFPKNY